VGAPPQDGIDVFFVLEPDAPRALVVGWLAALRAAGRSSDLDYAGRSLKGQLTQAGRLGAGTTVIVDAAAATVRRRGSDDQSLSHDAVVSTLSP